MIFKIVFFFLKLLIMVYLNLERKTNILYIVKRPCTIYENTKEYSKIKEDFEKRFR